MDAFYASVEIRDTPALAGRPVCVGGPSAGRGVISAASYEARKFGVHSAMPTSQAARLCPELVLLPPDFNRYPQASRELMEIFRRSPPLAKTPGPEMFFAVTRPSRSFAASNRTSRGAAVYIDVDVVIQILGRV